MNTLQQNIATHTAAVIAGLGFGALLGGPLLMPRVESEARVERSGGSTTELSVYVSDPPTPQFEVPTERTWATVSGLARSTTGLSKVTYQYSVGSVSYLVHLSDRDRLLELDSVGTTGVNLRIEYLAADPGIHRAYATPGGQ